MLPEFFRCADLFGMLEVRKSLQGCLEGLLSVRTLSCEI